MAPITKLTKKTKTFLWTKECQKAWELIKQKYIETPILISPNQQVEFHVHIVASLLDVGVMLSQNVTWKSDQPIVCCGTEQNKIIAQHIERLQQWFFLCTSTNIICWAISLSFMQIIWHWSIWSTNYKCQGKQLDGCYCFLNTISQ